MQTQTKAYRHKNTGPCLSLCTSEAPLRCGSKFCTTGFIFVYREIASCWVLKPQDHYSTAGLQQRFIFPLLSLLDPILEYKYFHNPLLLSKDVIISVILILSGHCCINKILSIWLPYGIHALPWSLFPWSDRN